MNYILRELQSENSRREGEVVTARTLTAAKRIASQRQAFHGTILTLEVGGGIGAMETGEVVAVKRGGHWTSQF